MRRKKVVIVDDEETIVLGLMRILYQDNARYDVLPARDAEIAQQVLAENDVDVMVADIRLPGMSGLDLLVWAASESPATRVIVMTAFDVDGLEDKAYRFGCLRIVQKPFDLHVMHALVLEALDPRDAMAGSLSTLSPADILQMLCLSRKTTSLRVVHGRSYGMVHVENGEIIHATWDEEAGETAVYRVLAATGGMFNTLPLRPEGPRTIDSGWQYLLIEGMRRADEERSGRRLEGLAQGAAAGTPTTPLLEQPHVPAPAAATATASAPTPAPAATTRPAARSTGTPESSWPSVESWTMPARAAAASGGGRGGRSREAEVAKLIDAGFGCLREGTLEEARRVWREALELDPGNRMIELNLRKLEEIAGRRNGS